jgi:hypothetical protein
MVAFFLAASRQVVFSALNVASWHVARYDFCAVRAADCRQLLLVAIVAGVAPAQRHAH